MQRRPMQKFSELVVWAMSDERRHIRIGPRVPGVLAVVVADGGLTYAAGLKPGEVEAQLERAAAALLTTVGASQEDPTQGEGGILDVTICVDPPDMKVYLLTDEQVRELWDYGLMTIIDAHRLAFDEGFRRLVERLGLGEATPLELLNAVRKRIGGGPSEP